MCYASNDFDRRARGAPRGFLSHYPTQNRFALLLEMLQALNDISFFSLSS